jgi:hypothetical protein
MIPERIIFVSRGIAVMTFYRVISEEWSVFWEMLLWRILRKKICMTVSISEWLPVYSGLNLQIQKHFDW